MGAAAAAAAAAAPLHRQRHHRHHNPSPTTTTNSILLTIILFILLSFSSSSSAIRLVVHHHHHHQPSPHNYIHYNYDDKDDLLSQGRTTRRLIGPGSSPPTCRSKCGTCTPCKPVHVPIQQGMSVPLEYYPEAWRCKCGNKLYMP